MVFILEEEEEKEEKGEDGGEKENHTYFMLKSIGAAAGLNFTKIRIRLFRKVR